VQRLVHPTIRRVLSRVEVLVVDLWIFFSFRAPEALTTGVYTIERGNVQSHPGDDGKGPEQEQQG